MRRLLALTVLLGSSSAFGQSDFQTGAYVGVGFKQLEYKAKNYTPEISFSESSSGPHLYGGIRFSETLAFEAAHTEVGTMQGSSSGTANLLGDYSATVTGDIDVTSVRILAYTGRVMFGLGYFDAGIKLNLEGTSQAFGDFSESISDSDNGLTYLFGGEWPVNDWGVRLEVEYTDLASPYSSWNIGIGGHYKWK